MKGNFSALAVKRIREKSKNDPPYSPSTQMKFITNSSPQSKKRKFTASRTVHKKSKEAN
jgi:hypothetical protein